MVGLARKALGIFGIKPDEEKITKYLDKKFGEQIGPPVTPEQAETLIRQMQSEKADFNAFNNIAKKVVLDKKMTAIKIDQCLVALKKEFASEHLFPTTAEIKKGVELPFERLVGIMREFEFMSRRYSIVVKTFLTIVLHEYQMVKNDMAIDARLTRGWETGIEVSFLNELTALITEMEKLNNECQSHLNRIDSAGPSMYINHGWINVRGIHNFIKEYYVLEGYEERILKLADKFVKRATPYLKKISTEIKTLHSLRGHISDWNASVGAAKRHSWRTAGNTVGIIVVIGMFCSFGVLAPLMGPIRKAMEWGESALFGREISFVQYIVDYASERYGG